MPVSVYSTEYSAVWSWCSAVAAMTNEDLTVRYCLNLRRNSEESDTSGSPGIWHSDTSGSRCSKDIATLYNVHWMFLQWVFVGRWYHSFFLISVWTVNSVCVCVFIFPQHQSQINELCHCVHYSFIYALCVRACVCICVCLLCRMHSALFK